MKISFWILNLSFVCLISCKEPGNDNAYDHALKDARQQQKFVILDFTAKWCGGCLGYDKYVFQDNLTAEKLKEKYILLKIDRDNPANFSLVRKYRIQGLPHIVLIDNNKRILGGLEGFYGEFVEKPDSFIHILDFIVNSQEKIVQMESVFHADTTNPAAIGDLLEAYTSVGQYIEIQHLTNLLVQVDPSPERLYEHNFNQAIQHLRSEMNTGPLNEFLEDNPVMDEDHRYRVYSQLLYYYRDLEDVENQDVYYQKLLRMDPDYYKREYADFLFMNRLKIDTAIILADELISSDSYRNFFWGQYLNAHVLAFSGKLPQAVQSYGGWMEMNMQKMLIDENYWAFYFYARFANCHNVDLETALRYVQIAEKSRNMIDEKLLIADILHKSGRVDEAIEKLKEAQKYTTSRFEYDRITRLVDQYGRADPHAMR